MRLMMYSFRSFCGSGCKMRTGAALFAAVCIQFAALCIPFAAAQGAPKSELIDSYWLQSNPASRTIVDHEPWAAFLSKYVAPGADGINRVRYGAAKNTPDHQALKAYLATLQAVDPAALTRDAQMAYWINLYNAITVDLVLDAYPVRSIKSVRGGLFNTGPWDVRVATVVGRRLMLNDIEHGILRPIWRDPRIHYAVNCASIGCPNLAARPYEAHNLEAMLDAAARDYVNHPRGVRMTMAGLRASSIYRWYSVDFGGSDQGLRAHLSQYAEPALQGRLGGRFVGYDYDWSLNDAR